MNKPLTRRFAVVVAAVLALSSSNSQANGGGYSRGGVSYTGTVAGFEPSGTENVRIMDEQLSIRLGRKQAEVEVRYVLKNTGRATSVRFGFPVEELAGESMFEPEKKPAPIKSSPEYCRNFLIEVGGKPVAAKFESETPEAKKDDSRRVGLKGWMVSKIVLGAGEEKTMTIRYVSEYPYSNFFVSDDGTVSARTFNYRLSTGACWADTIAKGRVVIEPDGVNPDEVRVLKPVNRFRREGGRWVWDFEKLEPALADDIVVEATPGESSYGGRNMSGNFSGGQRVNFLERNGAWYVEHTNYSVKASSTLAPEDNKDYSADNIRTWDNVWSEGAPGPGIGEWLELVPEVPQPLESIRITPGHCESKGLFKANARPRRVEVLINGSYRFETVLDDDFNVLQRIPITGYHEPVKKLRLTVMDVFPGSKYEDLCISRLALESRLKKKPHIQPAR